MEQNKEHIEETDSRLVTLSDGVVEDVSQDNAEKEVPPAGKSDDNADSTGEESSVEKPAASKPKLHFPIAAKIMIAGSISLLLIAFLMGTGILSSKLSIPNIGNANTAAPSHIIHENAVSIAVDETVRYEIEGVNYVISSSGAPNTDVAIVPDTDNNMSIIHIKGTSPTAERAVAEVKIASETDDYIYRVTVTEAAPKTQPVQAAENTQPQQSTPAKTAFLSKNRVVGYLPSYRSDKASSLDWSALTHVILSGATYSGGSVSSPFSLSTLSSISGMAHRSGVSAFISFRGGNELGSVLADNASRAKLINQIMSFVNEANLDGVDIDIESSNAQIWEAYPLFLSELGQALHGAEKQLSCAVTPTLTHSVPGSAYEAVDFLNLMTYDDDVNGDEVAPMIQISEFTKFYLSRGVSNDKLVIGLPFYGYDQSGTAHPFSEIVSNGGESAYHANGWEGISYNGADTIRSKCQTSKAYGGVMIWELGQDAAEPYSLLSVIKSEFPR